MPDFYEDSRGFKCFELLFVVDLILFLSPQEHPYL